MGADLRQNLNCSVPSKQGDGKESIILSQGFAEESVILRLAEIDESFSLEIKLYSPLESLMQLILSFEATKFPDVFNFLSCWSYFFSFQEKLSYVSINVSNTF